MPTRPQILVVFKKDAYRQYVREQQDARLIRLLRRGHPDVLEMRASQAIHEDSLEAAVTALRGLPVDVDLAFRATLRVPRPRPGRGGRRRYDLVVSVGGDGTFLQAARSVGGTPILGVNSNPSRSEAVFCAANRRTFPRLIRLALAGRLPVLQLFRLEVRLNGRPVGTPAVNDVLIAHEDPATMSRYRLHIGSVEEFQKSSGLWIATAAGSSSAVLAAGGVRLSWASRRFQYRPRELYRGRLSHHRLRGGVLGPGKTVRLTWLMRRGGAFIDGPHVRIPLRFADQIEIRPLYREPVRVLGKRKGPARAALGNSAAPRHSKGKSAPRRPQDGGRNMQAIRHAQDRNG